MIPDFVKEYIDQNALAMVGGGFALKVRRNTGYDNMLKVWDEKGNYKISFGKFHGLYIKEKYNGNEELVMYYFSCDYYTNEVYKRDIPMNRNGANI